MKVRGQIISIWNNRGVRGFSLFFAFFLVVGLVLLLVSRHGGILMFVNRHSSPGCDRIMAVVSNLGNGGVIALLWVLMGFLKTRYSLWGLVSLGLVAILTILMKQVVFTGNIRPLGYFDHDDFFRIVESGETHFLNGFPSGHAMAVFAAVFLLVWFSGKFWVGVGLFFVAFLVGLSRVYLLQHFFLDVYAGAVLGVILAVLTILICTHLSLFNNKRVANEPLCRFITACCLKSTKGTE